MLFAHVVLCTGCMDNHPIRNNIVKDDVKILNKRLPDNINKYRDKPAPYAGFVKQILRTRL